MKLRSYKEDDFSEVFTLLYETVHSVNAKDYTQKQLDAWVPSDYDTTKLKESLKRNRTVVATTDDGKLIVGFGDIDKTGYLDHLFVHKDYQKRGIAKLICDELEKDFSIIETHASLTAKPFFLKRGYAVEKEQLVERRGQYLKNFVMVKRK